MMTEQAPNFAGQYEVAIVHNEHGGFYARIPDFPSIFTGGESPEEALANAREAISLMVEEYAERGLPVPEPTARFSGHFSVRVPKSLHRELVRRAEAEGVSLNALVQYMLAGAVRTG